MSGKDKSLGCTININLLTLTNEVVGYSMETVNFEDILSADRIQLKAQAASRKKALELLGTSLSESTENVSPQDIVDSLCARERLGSTGIGQGVAIPHARSNAVDHTTGAIITLSDSVDFDAIDGQPVDFLFGLLVPESADDDHLQVLASIARVLNDQRLIGSLKQCGDTNAFCSRLLMALDGAPSSKEGAA